MNSCSRGVGTGWAIGCAHEETIGERLVRDLAAFHDLPPAPYDGATARC
jgi:hypothetical protein